MTVLFCYRITAVVSYLVLVSEQNVIDSIFTFEKLYFTINMVTVTTWFSHFPLLVSLNSYVFEYGRLFEYIKSTIKMYIKSKVAAEFRIFMVTARKVSK